LWNNAACSSPVREWKIGFWLEIKVTIIGWDKFGKVNGSSSLFVKFLPDICFHGGNSSTNSVFSSS